jgi:uncharacterized membrane protein YjgN (DUF898 family)
MTDIERQRYHWDRGQTYVVEAGKSLVLINGGGAIAMMTFVGNGHIAVSFVLGSAIVLFALGALNGTVMFLFAYLAELKYGNDERKDGLRWHGSAYVPAVFAAVLFVIGMLLAAIGLRATP